MAEDKEGWASLPVGAVLAAEEALLVPFKNRSSRFRCEFSKELCKEEEGGRNDRFSGKCHVSMQGLWCCCCFNFNDRYLELANMSLLSMFLANQYILDSFIPSFFFFFMKLKIRSAI